MLHPYNPSNDWKEKIEATLEMCTVFKGVPQGPALITFSHPNTKWQSFKGIGVFDDRGQLHNAPFTCIRDDGWGHCVSKMVDGRPCENLYATYFNPDGYKHHLDSLLNKADVSGW